MGIRDKSSIRLLRRGATVPTEIQPSTSARKPSLQALPIFSAEIFLAEDPIIISEDLHRRIWNALEHKLEQHVLREDWDANLRSGGRVQTTFSNSVLQGSTAGNLWYNEDAGGTFVLGLINPIDGSRWQLNVAVNRDELSLSPFAEPIEVDEDDLRRSDLLPLEKLLRALLKENIDGPV
jgi:hypothetical protein